MNITEEELNKIVKCREVGQVYDLSKPRMKYNSPANKEWQKFVDSGYVGIQCLMDKFRKIYGWRVAQAKFNAEDKSFDVTLMQNAKISEVKHVTYEEICKTMWWHSFELVKKPYMLDPNNTKNDGIVPWTYVLPKPFTFEEKEAVMKPLVEATQKRDLAEALKNGKKLTEEVASIADEAAK